MPKKLTIDPNKITSLLMRGFSAPMVAEQLNISISSAQRIAHEERPKWQPTKTLRETWKGARAKAAQILRRLRIKDSEAKAFIGCCSKTLRHYRDNVKPCGAPLIKVRLNESVTGNQGESVHAGKYRVVEAAQYFLLIKDDEESRIVHFIDKYDLAGKVTLISKSLFEIEE